MKKKLAKLNINDRNGWDRNSEKEYKEEILAYFKKKIDTAISESKDVGAVGNDLAEILRNSEEDVVRLITPRAVKKWAGKGNLIRWVKIIRDPKMVSDLRIIGRSIANTLRPLAGNNFALWVARILNEYFEKYKLPIKAITKGSLKKRLSDGMIVKIKEEEGSRDYKPDIDIVLIRTDLNNKPIAIISAKTTLAERVMQTINWSRFLKTANIPKEHKALKVYLVTAWETFRSGTNVQRVQELDGVYVCNKEVKEYGKIKIFSKFFEDIKALL